MKRILTSVLTLAVALPALCAPQVASASLVRFPGCAALRSVGVSLERTNTIIGGGGNNWSITHGYGNPIVGADGSAIFGASCVEGVSGTTAAASSQPQSFLGYAALLAAGTFLELIVSLPYEIAIALTKDEESEGDVDERFRRPVPTDPGGIIGAIDYLPGWDIATASPSWLDGTFTTPDILGDTFIGLSVEQVTDPGAFIVMLSGNSFFDAELAGAFNLGNLGSGEEYLVPLNGLQPSTDYYFKYAIGGSGTGNEVRLTAPFTVLQSDAEGPRVDVPVPATLALFGLGLTGLGWSRRKKA